MMMNVSRAKASSDRINEVLAVEPEIRSGSIDSGGVGNTGAGSETSMQGNAQSQPGKEICEGRIEFDRVSFTYGGEDEALREISFMVEPGQTVAILGSTGAGKSTLVNLIPRLYEASAGSVRIDGADVRELELHALRSRIGMVLQEAVLFSGTIRDNIRYGRPEATQEEVEAAAKAAQAHDFILGMPDGYDTRLGQRGINLSGGQKQRLSIARALLIRPAILIFDDSTSAVDLGTESRIQRALKEQLKDSTSLIIAQRISSVMEADRILVLEDGCIAASGTHNELMAHSEVYRDICRSQLREEDAVHAG
jgi:ATP-binding cassette, subfamily B, multidrug efflux pump